MRPRLLQLFSVEDERGELAAAEGETLPFPVARYFVVRGVPAGAARGGHLQREGHELISCVAGACSVDLRWPDGEATHRLDDPGLALHVPPGTWIECRDFSPDAVLLVLCSNAYDSGDQVSELP